MLRTGKSWANFQCYVLARVRLYCASKNSNGGKAARDIVNVKTSDKADSSVSSYHETYQQLDKLDFSTAAKILFTEPPKKKKFGFDFHLVQFFFACMPSLAVFLVAQYSRYEMRKMEAELEEKEKKKKQEEEEEEKAKAMELEAAEENEADPQRELKEVKVRLEKLEETVKEIAIEAKSKTSIASSQKQESSREIRVSSDPGISTDRKPNVLGGATGNRDPDPVSSQEEQKPRTQNGWPPQNTKR